MALGDFNGDGVLDLAVANEGSQQRLCVDQHVPACIPAGQQQKEGSEQEFVKGC
jgi:hypothetical protein